MPMRLGRRMAGRVLLQCDDLILGHAMLSFVFVVVYILFEASRLGYSP